MKKLFLITGLMLWTILSIAQSSSPFELYVEKDEGWYPSIYQMYIKQYSGIEVNRGIIDAKNIESIKLAIANKMNYKETSNIDEAMKAVQNGKKVFFFIDSYVWGGLEPGSTYSGSWKRLMPMCSGFYIYKKKCFQNEGINYHCGKKGHDHPMTFYIIQGPK